MKLASRVLVSSQSSHLKTQLRNLSQSVQCETCLKSFNRADTLKNHLLTHTGENYFKCETCFKSFNRADSLREHLLTHTGEKSFKCETCLKNFNQAKSLREHLLTHTEM